jgi:hypothetical protein
MAGGAQETWGTGSVEQEKHNCPKGAGSNGHPWPELVPAESPESRWVSGA